MTILRSIEIEYIGAERRQMIRAVYDKGGVLYECRAPCYFLNDLPDAATKIADAAKTQDGS